MIFKDSKIIVSNYGHLMSTQGHFQIKLTMIWFCRWSSNSVQCSRCKNTFLGTGNLQMITNKFWWEYLWVAYVMFLDRILYIVLVSSETEAYNLRSWLHEEKKAILLTGTGLVCVRGEEWFFEVIFEFKWKQPATKWLSTNNFSHT